jgi:hypothetical protein
VISAKAAKALLAGLDAEDTEMHCYCTDEHCKDGRDHPADDGRPQPRFGYAYVDGRGNLNRAANREGYGTTFGTLIDDVAAALGELDDFKDYIDEVVIIDRVTGQWWTGVEFRDAHL